MITTNDPRRFIRLLIINSGMKFSSAGMSKLSRSLHYLIKTYGETEFPLLGIFAEDK